MKRLITMADWKVTGRQRELVMEVLDSGRLTYGPKTKELEHEFAMEHGYPSGNVLFTNSGTMALTIAIHAMKEEYNWQDGDEIIMPALTFVATMNVIRYNNLTPVFVDIDYDTLNIDPTQVESAITPRTRAIMPVHLLGQLADMKSIMDIAERHNLKVIEDSCETMFVWNEYKGDVACFSSYLAHLMVTGVGGFIATGNEKLASKMRSMMFHGRSSAYLNIDANNATGDALKDLVKKRFLFLRQGYSARLTEMEAALGLDEIRNAQGMITQRQANAKFLIEALRDEFHIPVTNPDEHAFMMFPLVCRGDVDRDKLVMHLEENGIQTREIMPLTNQPVFDQTLVKMGVKEAPDFWNTQIVNDQGLLIPCHQYLVQEDLEYMVETIKAAVTL